MQIMNMETTPFQKVIIFHMHSKSAFKVCDFLCFIENPKLSPLPTAYHALIKSVIKYRSKINADFVGPPHE